MEGENDIRTQALRKQVLEVIDGGRAHLEIDEAFKDFPATDMNRLLPNMLYSPWAILEHIRIAQWDILEFTRNPKYISPKWPDEYWPHHDASLQDWNRSVEQIRADLNALRELVADPRADLLADLPHAPGYNLLREVMVNADHLAYHMGEFALLRQMMNNWPADHA